MEQGIIDYCKANKPDWYRGDINQPLKPSNIALLGANYKLIYRNSSDQLNWWWDSGICHAGLNIADRSHAARIRRNAEALVTLVMPFQGKHEHKFPTEESLHAYYHWMSNESPVAYVYITKDPVEMIRDGLIINPKVPISHFIFACILSRVPTEFHTKVNAIKIFTEGMKAGVSPLLALSVGYSTHGTSLYLANTRTGHSPINLNEQGLGNIRAVIKGEMGKTDPTLYTEFGTWGGVFALFNRKRPEVKFANTLESKLRSVILGDTVVVPTSDMRWGSTNPHLSNNITDQQCSRLISFLLFFQEDIMKIPAKQTWLDWQPTPLSEAA